MNQACKLLLVEDDCKGAHGETCRLADLGRVRSGELSVDSVHESLLVHKILLSLDEKSELLEDFGTDFEALPGNIFVFGINSLNQWLVDLLNDDRGSLI